MPAATAGAPPPPAAFTEAVTVDPFNPNVMPFEFEKVIAERLLLVVPADTFMFVSDVATDPVSVLPFRPNETPFEFEKVTAERLFDVVPAETLMFVSEVATEPVIVEPFRPNETPLLLENTICDTLVFVVPALKFTAVKDELTIAEIELLLKRHVTLLPLTKENALAKVVDVPALMPMFVNSVPPDVGKKTVPLPVGAASRLSMPPELERPIPTVEADVVPI